MGVYPGWVGRGRRGAKTRRMRGLKRDVDNYVGGRIRWKRKGCS